MKVIIPAMLAAVFTVAILPAQAAVASANTGRLVQTLSMGDGADHRQCKMLEKRGKKLPGYCKP